MFFKSPRCFSQNKFFKIGNKFLGKGKKVFIIAEIGVNHEGDFNKCIKLFKEAKFSGADAVKLQTVDYKKRSRNYKRKETLTST